MVDDKKQWRRKIGDLFASTSAFELEQRSRRLSERLRQFLELLPERSPTFFLSKDFIFGAYAPMSDEVQWHLSFLSSEKTMEERTSFPAMDGEDMRFYRCAYQKLEWRKDFHFSILCPPRECPQVEPPVLLIPGRAFSLKGDRLGRGKAYYDKYLRNYKGIKIGLCFEMQLFAEIPVGNHDCPVDYVVTEDRIIEAHQQTK